MYKPDESKITYQLLKDVTIEKSGNHFVLIKTYESRIGDVTSVYKRKERINAQGYSESNEQVD